MKTSKHASFLFKVGACGASFSPDNSNFDQLDTYSVLTICDWLEVSDLASFVLIAPKYHQIISQHYIISKYRLHEGYLRLDATLNVVNCWHIGADKKYTLISEETNQTLFILKAFCPLFGQLNIEITSETFKPQLSGNKITEYVNKYCSRVPQKAIYHQMSPYMDIDIAITFPNVTDGTIYVNEYTMGLYNISVNELFPRLQKLTTRYATSILLDQHYPYLTYFKVYEVNDRNSKHDQWTYFLRMNPQLETFESPQMCNLTFLLEVSQFLPNMKTLSMKLEYERHFAPTSEIIRLQNVRIFEMNFFRITNQMRENLPLIKFDRLESVKLSFTQNQTDSQEFISDWIAQYKTLTSIELNFDMASDYLIGLAKGLDKLKTMKLNCASSEAATEIHNLMINGNNLEEIVVFEASEASQTCFDSLIESLVNWTVISRGQNQMTLKKNMNK